MDDTTLIIGDIDWEPIKLGKFVIKLRTCTPSSNGVSREEHDAQDEQEE
jgi:hypothetical protein